MTRPVRADRSSTSPYSSCEEARSNRPPAAKHDLPRATFHRLQLEQEPRSKGHRFLAVQSGQLLEIMRTLYSFLLSSFVSVFCVFVCALHPFFHFVAAPFTLSFPFGIVLCIRKARTPRHPLLFTHQVCSVQSDKGWILGVRMLVNTSYCSRRTFFRKFAGRNFDLEYLPRLACEPLYSDSLVESPIRDETESMFSHQLGRTDSCALPNQHSIIFDYF